MNDQEMNKFILAQERTLLAAERTFSAWLRTALAAMAGGIAILRLIIFRSETHRMIGHVIGETLILWGCLIIILSSIDYKRTRDKVHVRSYKSSKLGFLIVVIPLLIVSVLLVWITVP